MDTLPHGTDEEFEMYVLGRLAQDQATSLEEHLLVCEPCRLQLDETAQFCAVIREGLAKPEPTVPRAWFSWLRMPSLTLAASATALVLVAALAGWFTTRAGVPLVPLAAIQLSAMRGEMPVIARARETEVKLVDAEAFTGTVELVDANGGPVWKGKLSAGGVLRLRQTLGPGDYFIRLLEGARLVREYGFRVR